MTKRYTEKEALTKSYWYVSSLLIMIHNKFPEKAIYTTESIVHKYKLGSDIHILLKEDNGLKDWMGGLWWDDEYVLPKDKKPEDYFILYEQLNENSYNEIDPRFGEFKGEQCFLVIRNNTRVTELHLCKLENKEVKFLKEVVTSIY